jgi:hypothetical protein
VEVVLERLVALNGDGTVGGLGDFGGEVGHCADGGKVEW